MCLISYERKFLSIPKLIRFSSLFEAEPRDDDDVYGQHKITLTPHQYSCLNTFFRGNVNSFRENFF